MRGRGKGPRNDNTDQKPEYGRSPLALSGQWSPSRSALRFVPSLLSSASSHLISPSPFRLSFLSSLTLFPSSTLASEPLCHGSCLFPTFVCSSIRKLSLTLQALRCLLHGVLLSQLYLPYARPMTCSPHAATRSCLGPRN